MTIAVCTNCGELKHGAWCTCPMCESEDLDGEVSILLSDHNLSEDELRRIGDAIHVIHDTGLDEEMRFHLLTYYLSRKWPKLLEYEIDVVEPQLQRKLEVTTVYVTHDLTEAEEMADRIAVIQDGHVEQVATMEEVFFFPRNERVSDFIGAPNILNCERCHALGNGVIEASCGDMRIVLPYVGNSVQRIAIFPRDIYVSQTKPPGPEVNRFRGTITSINHSHDAVRLKLRSGGNSLLAEVPHHIFEDMDLAVGKEVFLILKLRRIRAYEGKNTSERNI